METSKNFHRFLKPRHIQLIALGGALGTGLFYGSASTMHEAGPGIVLSYLICGLVIYGVMRALGELAVRNPVAGSFSTYAFDYWGDLPGFVVGWNYWFNYSVVCMAELTAISAYFHMWWTNLPQWIPVLIFWAAITLLNLGRVNIFGEMEFWLALVKVVAIIAMIVFGLVLIGFRYSKEGFTALNPLWSDGGFFPNGISGVLNSLAMVLFAYGGTELVGITAGEADDPSHTIPSATKQIMFRIIIFYVGSVAVMITLFPWRSIGLGGSPFVTIFSQLGIPSAAFILNLVVITAALSAFNSGLYSNGRILSGLAQQGNAPEIFSGLNQAGSPIWGILLSSMFVFVAVILNFFVPKQAFNMLASISSLALLVTWSMIIITHWKFRMKYPDEIPDFKMPWFPFLSYVLLGFMILATILLTLKPATRPSLYIGVGWLLLLVFAYYMVKLFRRDSA